MLLRDCLPHLIHTFSNEADLIRAIGELSQKFTSHRQSINDYLKDPRLVSAYTAFYLTTNMPKLAAVLKWMPAEWIAEIKKCQLIDLGAGPGTMSLAWMEMFKDEFGEEIFQIETSSHMRDQGKKLWQGLYPDRPMLQLKNWDVKTEKKKLLIFGHSANEMGPKLALEYIHKINPAHILFIEPGTKDFFPQMLEIRKELIAQNFHILYPCPKQDACPMQGTEDWCHQFIQVKLDPEVERLTQMARKDRKLLPLTVHAFSRKEQGANASERLVRVLPETKFSFEWEVCHNNSLEQYQVMKRGLDKKTEKNLSETLAGARIVTEIEKEFEGKKRVKVIKSDP